ncbi:hypothetical protein E2986_12622 [Frieseomelitta varia]|uniref:Uncharacterized protein n=1 Tax=Frieseomelitta varia TaxID=561572 RepID=A0A833SAL6_9HYME|nr:hypothetical protein E2986_12622 [Frieseomelitta varia]
MAVYFTSALIIASAYWWFIWGNTIPTSPATNITLSSSLKPPTASLTFNTPSNFATPLPMSESNSSFQLQKPPIGNKRGKH